MKGHFMPLGRSKARLRRARPAARRRPIKNKERVGRTRKGDASEFRAQFDELSPGLLKSPFSRWLLEPPSGEGGEGGEDSLLSS